MAMENAFLKKLRADPRFRSTERISDPALLEPAFRRKVETILKESRRRGQEYVLFETYRSRERQAELFRQGVTQLRTVGVHHYGLAADLVRKVDGRLTWEADYRLLGELADAQGLVWGGRWKFRDAAHVQAIAVKDQAKLFRGEWFPS
ncbi:M15 family peptidase [bacterium]|nr:MAG: M15 family peptidase [bacterium]